MKGVQVGEAVSETGGDDKPSSASMYHGEDGVERVVAVRASLPKVRERGEVDVNVGDVLLVKKRFNDGWAFGWNDTLKLEGFFPITCFEDVVIDMDEVVQDDASGDVGETSKRVSSRGASLLFTEDDIKRLKGYKQ